MLGVKFQKNKNIMFLVCNKGTFFKKVEKQLHSSFKEVTTSTTICSNDLDEFLKECVIPPPIMEGNFIITSFRLICQAHCPKDTHLAESRLQ